MVPVLGTLLRADPGVKLVSQLSWRQLPPERCWQDGRISLVLVCSRDCFCPVLPACCRWLPFASKVLPETVKLQGTWTIVTGGVAQ